MRRYRVERYVPGITSSRLSAELARIEAAAGESVRYLGSTFSAEEESCFSSFEAGSLEAVERVCHRAGIPFARIVEVEECPPGLDRAKGDAMWAKTERRRNAAGLRKVSLFADCSDRELIRIDQLLTELNVLPGRMLMASGSAALQFMIVCDGYGRVSADGADIGRVGPGSCVGEHSFRGQAWNATITALTPMTVYVLNAGELATLLADVPALKIGIAGAPTPPPEPQAVAQPGFAYP